MTFILDFGIFNRSTCDMAERVKKNAAKTQYFATISGDLFSELIDFIDTKLWTLTKNRAFLF